jgi:quercetin dioxygenase-like cupin family protein
MTEATQADAMSADTGNTVLVRGPGDGPATWALGGLFEQVASGAETAGSFSLSLVTQPPGAATPLHVHTREAEAFYLLDGRLTYQAGEHLHHLVAGSFIYLPADIPHAFRVTGAVPARFLAVVAPGGLMDLYDEVGQPADQHQLPEASEPSAAEIERWLTASPRYGLRVLGPPLPPEA